MADTEDVKWVIVFYTAHRSNTIHFLNDPAEPGRVKTIDAKLLKSIILRKFEGEKAHLFDTEEEATAHLPVVRANLDERQRCFFGHIFVAAVDPNHINNHLKVK